MSFACYKFLSFVSIKVGLLLVAAVFLTDSDIYIAIFYRPPSNTALQVSPCHHAYVIIVLVES